MTPTTLKEPEAVCLNCSGEGWVCENHPHHAWPDECDCGAGMPCKLCNCDPADRNAFPRMPPGSVETWRYTDDDQ